MWRVKESLLFPEDYGMRPTAEEGQRVGQPKYSYKKTDKKTSLKESMSNTNKT